MQFEWHEAKAQVNLRKHGVSFFEARQVLENALSITVYDDENSESEDRFVTIGFSLKGRVLVVVHSERNNVVRIISARRATRREREEFEHGFS